MTMKMICTNCYETGSGKRVSGGGGATWVLGLGSLVGAVFFWPLIFGLVGAGVWQYAGMKRICAKCGKDTLVTEDSPRGREIAGKK